MLGGEGTCSVRPGPELGAREQGNVGVGGGRLGSGARPRRSAHVAATAEPADTGRYPRTQAGTRLLPPK